MREDLREAAKRWRMAHTDRLMNQSTREKQRELIFAWILAAAKYPEIITYGPYLPAYRDPAFTAGLLNDQKGK